ncbi:MAG: ABC transporter permease [Bacteroidota bacterium]|nr:ABC transporter permease [Bacteroidota bacterium]
MLKNHFLVAFRNLWKNKVYSAINIVGLAIGMGACLLIMVFVFYEKSFDQFHTKNIWRLNEVQKFPGMVSSQKVGLSMFPMGPTLMKEFPEIKNFTRIHWEDKFQVSNGDKRLYLPHVHFVDSTFLQMFDFKLLKGDRATALLRPNSILLTSESAKKLFGTEDPVGKTVIHYSGDTTIAVVTGILEDVPQNSQLQFDALVSFSTFYHKYPDVADNWGGNWLDTYFELAPGTDAAAMEKRFPAYLKKYLSRGDSWKYFELFLLPLREVHAGASEIGLDYLNYQKFDKKYTNIFLMIAVIVLLIACVNFMNLSTARSAERAREVGIRKSIGAQRWQLSMQFLSEAVLLSFIALVLALVLAKLFLPFVRSLSQRNLQLPLFENLPLLLAVVGGTLIIGILSGLYPAAYLSSFQPVKVLKGSIQTGKSKGRLRNILVVTQFASAVFLMIATIIAVRQLRYMQQRDPGFSTAQVVTVPLDDVTSRKFNTIRQDLLANSLVSGVTAAQDQLGSHLDQSGVGFKGDGPLRRLTSTRLIVDPDYLRLYKIRLAYGKDFSREKGANGREYIINEALAKELLKDNPRAPMESLLGNGFGFDSAGILVGRIVGIAKDFNFNSLHYKIETMFIFNQNDWGFSTLSVRIDGSRAREAVAFIGSVWHKDFPDHPFEYQFLDDHFADVYRADTQVSSIVGVLAGLAILISCLGLFGLASYSAEKRVKEIGIRKVLGASVQNIVRMLSGDFLKRVLIATVIAWPLAWWAMNKWLQDFAYRIDMSWWIFIAAGGVALLIALVTISLMAIKAAVTNPVKSLRSE